MSRFHNPPPPPSPSSTIQQFVLVFQESRQLECEATQLKYEVNALRKYKQQLEELLTKHAPTCTRCVLQTITNCEPHVTSSSHVTSVAVTSPAVVVTSIASLCTSPSAGAPLQTQQVVGDVSATSSCAHSFMSIEEFKQLGDQLVTVPPSTSDPSPPLFRQKPRTSSSGVTSPSFSPASVISSPPPPTPDCNVFSLPSPPTVHAPFNNSTPPNLTLCSSFEQSHTAATSSLTSGAVPPAESHALPLYSQLFDSVQQQLTCASTSNHVIHLEPNPQATFPVNLGQGQGQYFISSSSELFGVQTLEQL